MNTFTSFLLRPSARHFTIMVAYIITTNDTLTSTAIELEATQAFVRTRPGLTLTPIFGPSRAEFSISGVPWYYAVVAVEEQDVERIQKQLFHIVNTSCNDAAKTVATCHACGGRKEMAEREGHVDWVGRYKEFFVVSRESSGRVVPRSPSP